MIAVALTIIAMTLLAPVLTLGWLVIYRMYRYSRRTTGDVTRSPLRLLQRDWIEASQPEQWEEVIRRSGELGRSFIDDDLSERAGFKQDGKIT